MDKPQALPDTFDWPEETINWFEGWRDSPLTDDFDQIKWNYLFDTALIHATAYLTGQVGYLSQVSAREREMGLSFAKKQAEKPIEIKVTPLGKAKADREARESRSKNTDRARKAG